MTDARDLLPVYTCHRDEWTPDEKPSGFASTRAQAAKIIREETGDPAYRAADIEYSTSLNAWFPE